MKIKRKLDIWFAKEIFDKAYNDCYNTIEIPKEKCSALHLHIKIKKDTLEEIIKGEK